MKVTQMSKEIIKKLRADGYTVSIHQNYFIVSDNFGFVRVTEEPNEKGFRWRVDNGHLLRAIDGVIYQIEEILKQNFKVEKAKVLRAIKRAFYTAGQALYDKETGTWTIFVTDKNDKIKFEFKNNTITNIRVSADMLEKMYYHFQSMKNFVLFYNKEQQ